MRVGLVLVAVIKCFILSNRLLTTSRWMMFDKEVKSVVVRSSSTSKCSSTCCRRRCFITVARDIIGMEGRLGYSPDTL